MFSNLPLMILWNVLSLVMISCTSSPLLKNITNNETTEYKKKYVVTKVIDGDTFWVQGKKDKFKVRLIGIDAPETQNRFKKKKGFYGIESKAFLENKIGGKEVILKTDVDSLDRYGRTLAYAYLTNGTFINEELVANGMATIMTIAPNITYEALFLELQVKARNEKKGLWSKEINFD